jgi:hypothetical protein
MAGGLRQRQFIGVLSGRPPHRVGSSRCVSRTPSASLCLSASLTLSLHSLAVPLMESAVVEWKRRHHILVNRDVPRLLQSMQSRATNLQLPLLLLSLSPSFSHPTSVQQRPLPTSPSFLLSLLLYSAIPHFWPVALSATPTAHRTDILNSQPSFFPYTHFFHHSSATAPPTSTNTNHFSSRSCTAYHLPS